MHALYLQFSIETSKPPLDPCSVLKLDPVFLCCMASSGKMFHWPLLNQSLTFENRYLNFFSFSLMVVVIHCSTDLPSLMVGSPRA